MAPIICQTARVVIQIATKGTENRITHSDGRIEIRVITFRTIRGITSGIRSVQKETNSHLVIMVRQVDPVSITNIMAIRITTKAETSRIKCLNRMLTLRPVNYNAQ